MAEEQALPFESFSFTLLEEKRPRIALRMKAADGGKLYELRVEKGPASNATALFSRKVPTEVAQRFKDSLQDAGVFGWEESYDDDASRGMRRWTLNLVFKEGVFSLASRGGSNVPLGFDRLLDELYRLDFPRPGKGTQGAGGAGAGAQRLAGGDAGLGNSLNALGLGGMGSINGMTAGDLGAYSATGGASGLLGALGQKGRAGAGGSGPGGMPGGFDFSQLADALNSGALEGNLESMMQDLQRNPQALQQRMREEFRQLPPDEQERMLDALAATGMASRAWWERFLKE
ncbi:MAG TPA: hypothetical protein DCP91_08370 [Eggerthellaceae bacterium]|nr:hypothetical protein [Eggerthellaceae bacterium]